MKKLKGLCLMVILFGLLGCGGEKIKTVTIRPVGNQMKFMTREITAKAGTQLKIVMENTATDVAMIHNVVVLSSGDNVDIIATAAVTAEGNIPSHADIIGQTPYANPGETTEVIITVPPVGEYPYLCTYPGHYKTMQGVLISVK